MKAHGKPKDFHEWGCAHGWHGTSETRGFRQRAKQRMNRRYRRTGVIHPATDLYSHVPTPGDPVLVTYEDESWDYLIETVDGGEIRLVPVRKRET